MNDKRPDEERAQQLRELARDDPSEVSVTELEELLTTGENDVIRPTMGALRHVARDDPDAVVPLMDVIREYLHADSAAVAGTAAAVVTPIAESRVEEAIPLVDDLLTLLSRETAKMDEWDIFSSPDEIPHASINALPYIMGALIQIEFERPDTIAEATDDLKRLLSVLDLEIKFTAARALAVVGQTDREYLLAAAEELRDCLIFQEKAEDPELRGWLGEGGDVTYAELRSIATVALGQLAEEHPEAVKPSIEELTECLDDVARATRANATRALAHLAHEYPDAVRSSVDELIGCLDDVEKEARMYAAEALAGVAIEYPEDVHPAVNSLQSLLDDPVANVRSQASYALAEVAKEYPDDVRPFATEFREFLDDEPVQINAAWALNVLAIHRPEVVLDAVDDLAALTDGAEKLLRENTVATLQRVGEEYPGAIRPVRADIAERLNDSSADIRQTAAEALVEIAAYQGACLNALIDD